MRQPQSKTKILSRLATHLESFNKVERMNTYGLIGKRLDYSFSQKYFTDKFQRENIGNSHYELFELDNIQGFPLLLENSNIKGLNVTIPYKQEVIPFLDEVDETALAIGAVNVIKPLGNGRWRGYNSDCIGFRDSLLPLLQRPFPKALILGTGGASKAIAYTLNQLGIESMGVSRTERNGVFSYSQLTASHVAEYHIWINTTPLGTYPDVLEKPDMPYTSLTAEHILYDLVYNPEQTAFMKEGLQRGAKAQNGLHMLHGQAEAAWDIWNT